MRLKKLALAALAVTCVAAVADDQLVEIYGILDLGYGVQQHGLPPNASFAPSLNDYNAQSSTNTNVARQTALLNGPLSAPRIGFRGRKELAGAWRVGYNLETGVNATTGQISNHAKAEADNSGPGTSTSKVIASSTTNADSSLDGQIFNRAAWFSIGYGTWGDLRVGRNTSFTFDALTTNDPVQLSQLFSPLGFSGAAGGGMGVSNNLRQDSSLKYLNTQGDLSYGLMYETGNGTGVAQQGSGWGAMVGYNAGAFKIKGTYQTAKDAMKTAASYVAGDISATAYDTVGEFLGVEYAASNVLNIKAGYEVFTLKAASDAVTLGSFGSALYGYQLAGTTSTALTSTSSLSYTGANQTTRIVFVGGDYQVMEKLKTYVGYYVVQPQAYGSTIGVTNTYTSLLLDYRIDEKLDAYAGLSHQSYSDSASGTSSPNNGVYGSNNLLAMGARYKF